MKSFLCNSCKSFFTIPKKHLTLKKNKYSFVVVKATTKKALTKTKHITQNKNEKHNNSFDDNLDGFSTSDY